MADRNLPIEIIAFGKIGLDTSIKMKSGQWSKTNADY